MGQRFQDKIVLITGAGSGIGLSAAEHFLEEGATVVGTMLTSPKTAFTDRADEFPGKCLSLRLDATDSTQVRRLADEVLERFGRIDILVNNAGIHETGSVLEMEEAVWDRMVAVNLKSVYLMSRAVIPSMQKHGGGAIVNLASRTGHQVSEHLACYCATKAAVIQLTKQMALDFAGDNIRVNCVVPGMVETPMLGRIFAGEPERKERVREGYPMKRFARAEEIAKAILFLAGDDASFMTGGELRLDGGRGVI